MNQRERTLLIIVGGLIVALGFHWGFGKYRDALRFRDTRIAALTDEQQRLQEQQLQGALADRQLGEYLYRSLPGDPEKAQSDYQAWLFSWVKSGGLSEANVDAQGIQLVQDGSRDPLYRQLSFRVTGKADLPGLIELLHGFYAKDYLHRIRSLTVTQGRTEALTLTMIVDAVALNAADPKASPPEDPSWRVAADVAEYRDPILNRNFFSPPNLPPRFQGRPEIEAIVGRTTTAELAFEDPEGGRVRIELAEGAPDFVSLDSRGRRLQIEALDAGSFDLLVRATDSGYPPRTTEQRLTVRAVPPEEPREEIAEPSFDDARMTVLTGLVEGREGWTAWLNVRTRGQIEKLRIGDGFEIGSVSGTVVAASPRYATIEAGGRRFDLKPGQSLADAAKQAADRQEP